MLISPSTDSAKWLRPLAYACAPHLGRSRLYCQNSSKFRAKKNRHHSSTSSTFHQRYDLNGLNMFEIRTLERRVLCRSRHTRTQADIGGSFTMSVHCSITKIGFDTAEKEPCQVCPISVYISRRSAMETLTFKNDNEECVERRQQIPQRLNEMLVRL